MDTATATFAKILPMRSHDFPASSAIVCWRDVGGHRAVHPLAGPNHYTSYSGRLIASARWIGSLRAYEWDFPPKPKWMRWRTYERKARQGLSGFTWLLSATLSLAFLARLLDGRP